MPTEAYWANGQPKSGNLEICVICAVSKHLRQQHSGHECQTRHATAPDICSILRRATKGAEYCIGQRPVKRSTESILIDGGQIPVTPLVKHCCENLEKKQYVFGYALHRYQAQ